MTPLEAATTHEGDPCVHCAKDSKNYRVTWPGPCLERKCKVLGCKQPQSGRHFNAKEGEPFRFGWCVTHGELYAARDEASRVAHAALAEAEAAGVVIPDPEGEAA